MHTDLTREEILPVLKSFGVNLPAETKLSLEDLDKRLCSCFNAAQRKDKLPDDLTSFNLWPSEGIPLSYVVGRYNRRELVQRARGNYGPDRFTDVFTDLRQVVLELAEMLDESSTVYLVQDPEMEHAIAIRVLRVLEVDERTPAFVLLYHPFGKADPDSMYGVEWAFDVMGPSPPPSILKEIVMTHLEMKVFLRLLKLNAFISPSGVEQEASSTEERFKASVLFPLGPLLFEDVSKLNNIVGCVVCGKKEESRCSRCLTVSYCGRACQEADWSNHRPACRLNSLKDGQWIPIRVRAYAPGEEDQCRFTVNQFDGFETVDDIVARLHVPGVTDRFPPRNVWGNKTFLVKITAMPSPLPSRMLIYDRKRSFEVFLVPEDGFDRFSPFMQEMWTPRAEEKGYQIFRWARRTGDWEFTICLDRKPVVDTSW